MYTYCVCKCVVETGCKPCDCWAFICDHTFLVERACIFAFICAFRVNLFLVSYFDTYKSSAVAAIHYTHRVRVCVWLHVIFVCTYTILNRMTNAQLHTCSTSLAIWNFMDRDTRTYTSPPIQAHEKKTIENEQPGEWKKILHRVECMLHDYIISYS